MKRSLGLSLAILFSVTTSSLAQNACAPEKFIAAVDAYANEPFGARAWRKLNGLGDPGIAGDSFGYNSYADGDSWSKLVNEILPGRQILANPGYNCRLAYPLQTLKARIATFGKSSDYVKQWLTGQEDVLSACAEPAKAGTPAEVIPPPNLKPAEMDLFKQDRAYQLATVLFYSQPQLALPALKAIAASNSTHKAAARYNVANLLANGKSVVEARAEAKAILADPALASVHGITRELLGYIANIEDTPQGWTELIDQTVETLSQPQAAIAGKPEAENEYAKALYDLSYTGVSHKVDDWWVTNTLPQDATISKALADAARKHPMVLWMMAGQSVNKPNTEAPWSLFGAKWQSWSSSYVDRAQALQKPLPKLAKTVLDSLKPATDEATRGALWANAQDAAHKAKATCGEAPETAAVTFLTLQAMRASALAGKYDEIYAVLPQLSLAETMSAKQTLVPKLMEHILATGNVEEGRRMRDALITPASTVASVDYEQTLLRDLYGAFMMWVAEDEAQFLSALNMTESKLSPAVLNLLPAAKLRELGDNSMFSAEQKALLKRAAWTRNYARGIKNAEKTTLGMYEANPELRAAHTEVQTQFPKLSASRVEALTILRNPRFGILVNSPDDIEPLETKAEDFKALDQFDPNDRNWWCPLETDRQLLAVRAEFDLAAGMSGVKDYNAKRLAPLLDADGLAKADQAREKLLKQHPIVKAVDWKEVAGLAKAASAPKRLSAEAIRWAKASKGDDGAPEALALAVRATRFGCRWHGSVKASSKPAQELLKAKFPATQWAVQTPHWFDCTDSTYDAQYNKVPNCKPRTWAKQALPR